MVELSDAQVALASGANPYLIFTYGGIEWVGSMSHAQRGNKDWDQIHFLNGIKAQILAGGEDAVQVGAKDTCQVVLHVGNKIEESTESTAFGRTIDVTPQSRANGRTRSGFTPTDMS